MQTQAISHGAPPDASRSMALLGRIAKGWGQRAQVKQRELNIDFDGSRPDFLERLLPFHLHPLYQALDERLKSRILSCGWLIYNEKTVSIELDIVSPSCQDILYENVPGLDTEWAKEIVCETLVDEAYHLLLVKNANRLTREMRDLCHIRIPQFALVRHMQEAQTKYTPDWAPMLVRLSTAIVSEIFISDYLHLLSDEESIQPFNRATVAAHRHDELAHSKIFAELARTFFQASSSSQKSFFAETLPKSVHWFADKELDLWLDVLKQLGVKEASTIIEDSRLINTVALDRVDYSGIVRLAEDIGILDTREGRSAFSHAGLV